MSGMLACSPGVCLEKPRGARIFKEQRSHSYGNRRAFIIIFFSSGNSPNPIHVFWSLLCGRMWSKAECRDLGERGGSDPVVGTFLKERGPRFLPRGTRCAHVSWKPVQSAFTQPIFSPQELFLVFKEEKKKSKKKKKPFTAWLLAYCAAEAVSSKGTSPPAAGGVFVGLPSLAPLLPAANADIPPPRDKASLSPWDISVSVPGRGGCLGSRPLLGAPPPLCLRLSGLLQAFRNHSTVSTASGVPSLRREGRPPWNIVNSPILGLAFFRKTDGHSLRGQYGCRDPAGLASRTACPKGPGRLWGRVAWARCEAIGSGGGCGERDRERPVDRAGGSSALADRCRAGMERPSLAGRSAFTSRGDGRARRRGACRAGGRQFMELPSRGRVPLPCRSRPPLHGCDCG